MDAPPAIWGIRKTATGAAKNAAIRRFGSSRPPLTRPPLETLGADRFQSPAMSRFQTACFTKRRAAADYGMIMEGARRVNQATVKPPIRTATSVTIRKFPAAYSIKRRAAEPFGTTTASARRA